MKIVRVLFAVALLLALPVDLWAGSLVGVIQTPSSGFGGIANGTITLNLTQTAYLAGSFLATPSAVNCWTDSAGNVRGLPGNAAVAAPVLSTGAGTLGAATYYFRYTWANSGGESEPSAERSVVLGGAGSVILAAPVTVPPTAASMKVYIGTSSGTETLQGSVVVTNGVIAGNYSQSVALISGAAPPSTNTSVCSLAFNDQLVPSYTGYLMTLTNVNGAKIPGFSSLRIYLSGGANGTVNVANGLPLYSGTVVYPIPIQATPPSNVQQSIAGPLNTGAFSMIAGAFISNSSTPAGGGVVRMANTDTECWKNFAVSGDVCQSDAGAAAAGTGNLADLSLWTGGGYQGAAFVDRSAAPAQSGVLRGGNNVCLVAARNAAGNGDVCAVQVNSSNQTVITGLAIGSNITMAEATAPSGVASSDILYADSTAHKLKANNNNGGAVTLAYIDLAQTWSGNQTNMALVTPTVNTGVSQGSGFKHQRFGSLCTTAAAAGATCTTAVTWTSAFTDANYTVVCTGLTQVNTATGPTVEGVAGAGFTIRIMAVTASASSFTTVDCIGVHD
ncbi:MAG: hypothetical protein LAP21_24010 [Acidobacteriia bacterium]|nr:hypothetical protein [Terriglobia bacterium]